MKKHPVVFAGLCLVIIAVIGAVFVLPSIAGNRYWEDAHLQNAVLDLSKYSEQIAGGDSDLDEIEAVVHRCNEAAVPVRSELSPFFEACNRMITDYFRDIYEIDVSDKMQMLQIMEATYPESVSEMVGGSYSGDFPEKLFVNAEYFDKLIGLIREGDSGDIGRLEYYAQYLTYEYCKAVNSDARSILASSKEKAVGMFEIRWFLGIE